MSKFLLGVLVMITIPIWLPLFFIFIIVDMFQTIGELAIEMWEE